METKDIKNIWKAGVEENIKPYSEEELNEMIVKSARKSIMAVYPGTIFRLVVIGVIIYGVGLLLLRNQSTERMFIDISALAILSVLYSFWERSAYKLRKYTNGKPIKEWLECRIKDFERNIKFNTKYNWVLRGCSLLGGLGLYALYQIEANTTPSILSVIILPLGIIIYLLIVWSSLKRNYQKALHELKDLYRQFEDSNE